MSADAPQPGNSSAFTERGQEAARGLLGLLDLESIEENLYRGFNESRGLPRLFGGQVLSQAVMAAVRTVPGRSIHSLHAYFIRAGQLEMPVLYEVDRVRDGRSFATRRVVAIQDGQPIFSMSASFQADEPGLSHAKAMPNVPPPDALIDDLDYDVARGGDDPNRTPGAGIVWPFEVRTVYQRSEALWSAQRAWNPMWVRFREPLTGAEDERALLAPCLLAYASDLRFVSTAALAHSATMPRSRLMMASLDHALWLHRPFDPSQWLLFAKRSTTASAGRGLNHAEVYSQDGALVASVTQEGLMRVRRS